MNKKLIALKENTEKQVFIDSGTNVLPDQTLFDLLKKPYNELNTLQKSIVLKHTLKLLESTRPNDRSESEKTIISNTLKGCIGDKKYRSEYLVNFIDFRFQEILQEPINILDKDQEIYFDHFKNSLIRALPESQLQWLMLAIEYKITNNIFLEKEYIRQFASLKVFEYFTIKENITGLTETANTELIKLADCLDFVSKHKDALQWNVEINEKNKVINSFAFSRDHFMSHKTNTTWQNLLKKFKREELSLKIGLEVHEETLFAVFSAEKKIEPGIRLISIKATITKDRNYLKFTFPGSKKELDKKKAMMAELDKEFQFDED